MVCGIRKAGVACEDYRQILSNDIWLLKFEERCLFDFRTRRYVEDLALEMRRALPFQFLNKQIYWRSDSQNSKSVASSIFEQTDLLKLYSRI
ncbi:hypothetical protein ACFXTH_038100 [Malus domestica]